MRRVLYVMANAFPGGAERATMQMLVSHDPRRTEPMVLFLNDGPLVEEARRRGLAVHRLKAPFRLRHPFAVARAIRETARLIDAERVAAVHSCMAYAHLIAGAAAAVSRVPAVLYQHGPVGGWMDGAATLLRCDRVLANSQYTYTQQRSAEWRRRGIVVVPYGIDMRMSPSARDALASGVNVEHGLEASAPAVGIIARFDPWKGIDVALRATAPLLRERPELRFLVVGGQYLHFHAGYETYLRELVDREGVAGQVIFAGYRADVRPYLARLTVLVHASVQPEPFGLTIIEAMSCGVPVVAARGGGASEIVEEGVDGFLYTAGSEPELRSALTRVLDDRGLRDSMAEAGRRKVDERYRPEAMIRALDTVYDDLLNGHVA